MQQSSLHTHSLDSGQQPCKRVLIAVVGSLLLAASSTPARSLTGPGLPEALLLLGARLFGLLWLLF